MFCSACGSEIAETSRFCPTCGKAVATATATRPYAGFWVRLAAYLIDGLITGIPVGILFFLAVAGGLATFPFVNLGPNPDPQQLVPAFLGMIVLIVPLLLCSAVIRWLYSAGMESSARQATLGKGLLSLRVTDLNGQRLSFGHASGRYFAKIVTHVIPLGIGWIMAGFTEKKQAVHDFIAGTVVWQDS